jgi:CRISPR-associated protein Cmr3
MANYQIILTPIKYFFFGGEKHSKGSNGLEMDYFVRSRYYPQQTALLGLVRYYLLMKNNLLNPKQIGKEQEASKLIGEKSFSFNQDALEIQNFGLIKSLSSLYFVKDNRKYIVAPKDIGYEWETQYGITCLIDFDPKKGLIDVLVSLDEEKSIVPFIQNDAYDDFVFIESENVGNKKGENNEDGFYKQVSYQLNKGWQFAFDLEIDKDILEEENNIVHFGAEQHPFNFSVQKNNKTDFILKHHSAKQAGLFCLSDCFVSEEIWKNIQFGVNEVISFRNLKSSNSSDNYASFSKGYKRSNRYNLLEKGSVVYFENKEKRDDCLKDFNNPNAYNIGYNHTISLN